MANVNINDPVTINTGFSLGITDGKGSRTIGASVDATFDNGDISMTLNDASGATIRTLDYTKTT